MSDTDRITAIEARLHNLPITAWQQRTTDAGIIEDAQGQPIAVLGTSAPDAHLALAEFLVSAPADVRWLLAQLREANARASALAATACTGTTVEGQDR